jgi:AraC-like DNA-binding protein
MLEPMSRSSRYVEYSPSPHLGSHLACVWTGETGDDGGYTDRVLPDACIDIIWDGSRVFVAGPDTEPVIGRSEPGSVVIGVRFLPGHAPAFLGVPAFEILDQRVDLADLWGNRTAMQIRDELYGLDGLAPADAMRALEARVASNAPEHEHATTTTDGVLRLVAANSAAANNVDALAADLGVTTRTLHRHCVQAFGYGAKTLQQVLRFRRFLSLAERRPAATLSQLAADAGYADQSHLTRDCNRLSGLTPRLLVHMRAGMSDPFKTT